MIPNAFHFVFFGNRKYDFGLLEYLAIKSAQDVNRPERIYFHTNREPDTIWWDRIKEHVTVVPTDVPTHIFGKELFCWQHRSDITRLQKLYRHGGIYMDFDTLCLRPFTDLLHHPCVLGRWYGKQEAVFNAVILCEPQSKFIRLWYNTYRMFSPHEYTEQSSKVPTRLIRDARVKPHIHTLEPGLIFCAKTEKLRLLFDSPKTDLLDDAYCIHYNRTLNKDGFLAQVDEEYIRTADTVFAKIARKHLGQ